MRLILLALVYFDVPEQVHELECDDPDFTYMVALRTYQRICFGGSSPRKTGCIGKGLSPFQKRLIPENNPKTGPGRYSIENVTSALYQTLNKVRSKHGMPPLASKSKRFKYLTSLTPGPHECLIWTPPKKHAKPFGVGSKLRELTTPDIPGPADYNLQQLSLCRRQNVQNNFGHPKRVPCIETICVCDPTHSCQLCGKLCEGEYYHKNYDIFLCQICVDIERSTNEYYDLRQLREFKKLRNCSFLHHHNKTKAAIRILTPHQLKKKFDIENYLDLYMKCF